MNYGKTRRKSRSDYRLKQRHLARNGYSRHIGIGERGKPDWVCTSLEGIKIPVLVAGGKSDIIFYTINSFYLEQNLPNAQLIVYPDAAHGSPFPVPGFILWSTLGFSYAEMNNDVHCV